MNKEHLEMLENGTCTFWKKKSLHKKSKDIKFSFVKSLSYRVLSEVHHSHTKLFNGHRLEA